MGERRCCESGRRPAGQAGLTLVELLAVVAILAMLASTALETLGELAGKAAVTGETNRFLASIHLARSESIKRNARVAMCTSTDGTTCTATPWGQGWIVFHDRNNNAARDLGESLLATVPGNAAAVSVTGNTPVARYLSFDSTGAARLSSGAFQAGTITVCNPRSRKTEQRQLVINAIGRPRVATASGLCPP